jgi:hypothetical protein
MNSVGEGLALIIGWERRAHGDVEAEPDPREE